MTYSKKTLLASAITLIFGATPAFAGNHAEMGDKVKHKDAMHKTHMKMDAATKAKLKASMTAEEKAAWPTMTKEERKAWKMKKLESWNMKSDAMTTSDTTLTKANDTVGEILQADGQPDPQMDNEVVMTESGTVKKSVIAMKEEDGKVANNAIVVPTLGTNVATTVTCPVGTTAQPDMTCMVTGDYEPAVVTTGAVDTKAEMKTWSETEMSKDTMKSGDLFIIEVGEDADYSEYKGTLRPSS